MSAGYTDLTVREYKKCVSKWANASDPKYRTLLWVIGSNANKDGDDRYQSIGDIRHEMRQAYYRIGDRSGWVPATSTIGKYLKELREVGILQTTQTRYQKRGKWVWGANIIRPNFDRILVDANAENWDFLAVLVPDVLVFDEEGSDGVATDERLNERRTSHGVATRCVLNLSTESKSENGFDPGSKDYVRSAPGAVPSGEEPDIGLGRGWDAYRNRGQRKEETVEDLEKKYGLPLASLVEKFTLGVVSNTLACVHDDWEDTLDLEGMRNSEKAKVRRDVDLWLAWLQQQGGEPWLLPQLEKNFKIQREKRALWRPR